MPYTRFIQELRIARERLEIDEYTAWMHSAFVGWQSMRAMGSKVPAFPKYMKKLGLREPNDEYTGPKKKLTRAELQRDKDKAFEALRLVEAKFDGGEP